MQLDNPLSHTWEIILNENANSKKIKRTIPKLLSLLESKSLKYHLHKTQKCGEGTTLARELCNRGCKHLAVAGGDGSINEVVNGIFSSNVSTDDVYLAVLPLGRGNDWVRTHNYPASLEDIVDLWLSGDFVKHDIGLVTSSSETDEKKRYFINIAGFGFDADVIYNVTKSKAKFLGSAVYVLSLLKTLFTHKPYSIRVSADENYNFDGKVFMVIVAIGKYNGSGICEAKYALFNDGLFDLIVVPKISAFKVISHLKDMFNGDHIDKIKTIEKTHTNQITICPYGILRGEVEGELLRSGNYTISLIPNAINVLSNTK